MIVVGIDAHKRNHTAVAVNEVGRKIGQRTTGTTSDAVRCEPSLAVGSR
jgi:transposase